MFEDNIIKTEEEAYILGFLYADGFVTGKVNNKYYSVGISLSKKDEPILIKFYTIFKNNGYNPIIKQKTIKRNNKSYDGVRLYLCDVKLVNRIISLGISPQKTYESSCEILNSISDDCLHHFLRGYFDGDGCITKSGHRRQIKIISLNKKFIEKINQIFISKCELGKKNIRFQSNKYPVIQYSGNRQCKKFGEFIYTNASIFLDRKKQRFDEIPKLHVKRSKYKGVIWNGQKSRWMAKIYIDKQNPAKYLGLFNSEEEANEKIKKYKNETKINNLTGSSS